MPRGSKKRNNKPSINLTLAQTAKKRARATPAPEGQRRAVHRSSLQQCPGCYQLFSSHRRLNNHRLQTNNGRCSLKAKYRTDEMLYCRNTSAHEMAEDEQKQSQLDTDLAEGVSDFEIDFDQDYNIDYDDLVANNISNNTVNDRINQNHQQNNLSPQITHQRNPQGWTHDIQSLLDTETQDEYASDQHLDDGDDSCGILEDGSCSQSSTGSCDHTFLYDQFNSRNYSHTIEEECYVELLVLLDSFDHPPPLKTFDLILDWCQGSYYKGFKFQNSHPRRKTLIDSLKQKFGMKSPSNKPWSPNREPQVKWVEQEGNKEGTYSVSFDASSQLESLLSDSDLMVPSKMVLNNKNPFHVYKSDGPINEIWDGSWYREATKDYGRRDFCVPIIIFLDKTGGDTQNQRYPVFPVVMTSAIFNRSTRNSPKAWRHLGFVSNSDIYLSKAQKRALDPGASVRNLHKQLHAIFNSLYELQKKGLWHFLRIGNKVKKVRLHFPICLILGDGQQGDDNTGRYSSHSRGINRISRFCYCQQTECADITTNCRFIVQKDIENLIKHGTDSELKRKSQHRCTLTFFRADFGKDKFGIFSIQPPCLQHTVAEGLVEYLLDNFIKILKPWQKAAIDECVYPWLRGYRQTIRSLFPTCNFVKGITSVKLVSADEKIGLLFSFALLASSKTGQKIFFNKPPHCQNDMTYDIHREYLHMFEAILCLEQTLARTEKGFWTLRNAAAGERELTNAINRLVQKLVKNCPRESGNGWDIAKVHEIRDFPRHITRSGCPSNFNAAIGESLLRPMGKHFIPNAQFRRKEFCIQLALRASEQAVCQIAASKYKNFVEYNPRKPKRAWESKARTHDNLVDDSDLQLSYNTRKATKLLFRLNENNELNISIFSRSKSKKLFIHETVEKFVEQYMTENELSDLIGFFEITVNNCIYRCHPDHASEGPWYDWIMIDFAKRNSNIEEVPCKLLLILENRFHVQEDPDSCPYLAAVQCCQFGPTSSSVLFRRWVLEHEVIGRGANERVGQPVIRILPVNSFKQHVYCFQESPQQQMSIPESKEDIEVLQAVPRKEWPDLFYNTMY